MSTRFPSVRVGRVLVVVVPLVVAFLVARPLVGAPLNTLGVVVGVAVAIVLLLRVQWAALTFVAIEPFEDWVRALNGSAVKGLGALLILSWIFHAAAPGLGMQRVLGHPVVHRPARRGGLGHPVALAGVGMIAVVLASTVLHSNGSNGAETLQRYLSFIGALIVLVDLMYEDLPVRRVLATFAGSCAFAAFAALVTFKGVAARVSGPLGDPNDFAFFMVSALPLALVLRRTARRPWLWDVAAVLIAGAAVGTLSRGALFATIAMFIFAVFAGVIRARVLAGVVAVLIVLVAVLAVSDPKLVENSLAEKQYVATQNVNERLVRWRVTAEMTIDYPVLGIGPGGFKTYYDEYVTPVDYDLTHTLDVAHETYLEISAELGLVGIGVFFAILFNGFCAARRRSRLDGTNDPFVALAGGVCAAIIAAMVAAIFLTEQYYIVLWLLPAAGAALDPRRRGAEIQELTSDENRTIVLQKGIR